MTTPGVRPAVVIGDSDGLIALLHEEDSHFQAARALVEAMARAGVQIIFPLTTIVETVTVFQRKLTRPEQARQLIGQITSDKLNIEPVDYQLMEAALALFDPTGSKQNTLFDAIVAATAAKYHTKIIFSFDSWYTKQGLSLTKAVY